jgi:hypothetical protein
MISRLRSWLVRGALVALATGLAGCTTAKSAEGYLLLQSKGLPAGVLARFSVDGHGLRLTAIKAGTAQPLSAGTYSVVASTVTASGVSYLPAKAGATFLTVTAHVTVRSGQTTHLTQDYVLKPAATPTTEEWQQLSSGNPFPITYALDQLACSSSTFCMAIGGPRAGDLYQSVWNGATWSPAVDTGLAGTAVNSLSCPSDRLCMMATGTPQMALPAFVDVWNGTTWASELPLTGAVYYTATCASSEFCMAVGQEPAGSAPNVAVWQGSAGWHLVNSPAESPDWLVDNVDCPSATFCALTFGIGNRAGPPALAGLVALWTDGVWHAQESLKTDSNWIGCVSASYCLLFAEQTSTTQKLGPPDDVYATWTGSRWTQVGAPESSDQSNYLYLGSSETPQCARADVCYETGTLGSVATASAATDLLSWNGSHWVAVSGVDQGGSAGQVACATGGYCLETGAGGTYARG